jgi:ribosomal 50S subunit-recycling heat shock protein
MSEPGKRKVVGEITHYFPHVSAAVVKLSAALKVGDRVKIVGGGNEFEQEVASMQIDRKPIEEAKKGDEVGLEVTEKAREGYKVYVV